jgi:mannose-6-phosphate isomerase-like protein (cupin superfamily)
MASKIEAIKAHDVPAIIAALRPRGRGKALSSFNGCTLGVARFTAHPLWERHPASDELLQVFEGALDLTVLAAEGPIEMTLQPGSVFIVPRGLWHSPRPRGSVSMLFLSNAEGSEVSDKKDPRTTN